MIEVGLMGGEGMVGLSLLLNVELSNTTVITQIPGRAARMRADDFRLHVRDRDGELRRLLMRYTNAFMAMIAQVAACNSMHTVEERLARWILLTHDRISKNEMPLTHEFLALMLGVRRSGVSVAASALRERGLIAYTREHLTVLDRE